MDSWIVLTTIVAYLGVTTGVGIFMVRRSRGGDDWAVAGRRMGLGLLTFGIVATRVGGVSTYGVAGDVIAEGVWNLWYAVGAVLAMVIMGWFFARPYRRLGVQTVGEIFHLRFRSRRCQTIASLCVQTEFLIVNIIEPFVIAQILTSVTGLSFGAAMACAALLLISSTVFGGLWGSAATNTVHAITIFGGLTAVFVAGLVHLGGWTSVVSRVNATLVEAGIDSAIWWHPVGGGWIAVIGMLLAAVIHTPAVSIWVNFAAAARDEKSVAPAFVIGGLMAGAASVLAGAIGIETLARYGAEAQVSSYQTLTRLAVELNPWIGGLAIGAVLAAVISSGGPILLASATMLVRDWIPSSGGWNQLRRLRAYRVTTILYGALAATIALLGPIRSILDLLLFAFAMVVPPGIAVAYVLYWKRATEAGVFWGMVLGYVGGLLWYGLNSWLGTAIDPAYPATLLPLVMIPVLSLVTEQDVVAGESFRRAVGV